MRERGGCVLTGSESRLATCLIGPESEKNATRREDARVLEKAGIVQHATASRGCMQRICIFCGSQVGTNGLYRQAATALGQLLVRHGYGLVYGGGHVGLMV